MRRFGPRAQSRKKFEIWPIMYMDLMTQVMVFFVVLWAVSQHRSSGVSRTVGDQTARMVNLPGDVLFPTGRSRMTPEGQSVLTKLFQDETGEVLNFDTGSLARRLLVIHGHTDGDGVKDDNFALGYQRALSVYHEIVRYGAEVPDHVILCTHADNSPAREVPQFQGQVTAAQAQSLYEAKAKNRRITIEDRVVSAPQNP